MPVEPGPSAADVNGMARVLRVVIVYGIAAIVAIIMVLVAVPALLNRASRGAIQTSGTPPRLTNTAPAPPTNFASSWTCPRPGAGWYAHLEWSPSPTPGASGYQVTWATSPTGPWKPAIAGGGTADQGTLSQTGVPAGSTRWYQIKALKINTVYQPVSSQALIGSAKAPTSTC
ncbi:MAG: hypothetical protein QOF30_218 [Acidimicrobiaceae bacterium]|nr:hypothetical protein [Acidimicrobiaceae bacterium]